MVSVSNVEVLLAQLTHQIDQGFSRIQADLDEVQKDVKELHREDLMVDLTAHIEHRLTVETISKNLEQLGFQIYGIYQESFRLCFLDGTTFFRHALIRDGFLDDWKRFIPQQEREEVFKALEENLNRVSKKTGTLELTIPIACIKAKK